MHLRTLFALLLSCFISLAAHAEPEAEVVHWWANGGDASAVSILIESFESGGGRWLDSVESDYQGARQQVISRLARGYPPTAMQWNAGLETTQFEQLGFLNTLEDIGLAESLKRSVLPPVLSLIKSENGYVGAPVNIHGENWMWSNSAVFGELGAGVPKTWEELIGLAPRLEEAGVVTVAQSNQDWQVRVLFNSVLLGVAGKEIYYRAYRDADSKVLAEPGFRQALNTFRALKPFAKEASRGSNWYHQVASVANGESALFFMGDWAKGEFMNLGAKVGVDFGCQLAPQTEGSYLFLSDVFIFGRVTDPDEIAVQRRFAKTILDRDVQIAFNRVKGSIPVRSDISPNELDYCGRIAANLMRSVDAPVPHLGRFGDGQFSGAIQSAVKLIWTNPALTSTEAIDVLTEVLDVEKQRRVNTRQVTFDN